MSNGTASASTRSYILHFKHSNLSTHCLHKTLCAFILSFDSKLTITLFNFKLCFLAAVSENR